ncbi:hypothetical protein [Nannocystis punicea]|uniref:Uncharacterized protein n=1 Tax=Nannocystis punicea TaxID=2995304 RepID=A0ABY7GV25_9BACT|nr:hypothetical protein [Nannocystis poenicansa]WAS90824.1 hypothetical protein O0S08_31940 [Nannocystis poenicansa]
MIEARALWTLLPAVILAGGCSKNPGGTEATSETDPVPASASETAADPSLASASETSAGTATASGSETTDGPVTSTGSSTSTTDAPTSDPSTTGSSTGAPATPCHLNFTEAACKAGVDCVFIPGLEVSVRDGECVFGELGEVGFCYHLEGGGPDAPSGYFEVETGRVVAFPNTPTPPPAGWEKCTCGAPSPEACQLCAGECGVDSNTSF